MNLPERCNSGTPVEKDESHDFCVLQSCDVSEQEGGFALTGWDKMIIRGDTEADM